MSLQDSEELLRNLHLAPYAKPIVSLIDDFPMVQRHKGWQFGFLQGNATRKMTCAPSQSSTLTSVPALSTERHGKEVILAFGGRASDPPSP